MLFLRAKKKKNYLLNKYKTLVYCSKKTHTFFRAGISGAEVNGMCDMEALIEQALV
jgi:hypothetical protein